jgi:hypothetical protein
LNRKIKPKMSEKAGDGTTAPPGDPKPSMSIRDSRRKKTDGVVKMGALSLSDGTVIGAARVGGGNNNNNNNQEPATTVTTMTMTTTMSEQVNDTCQIVDSILPGVQMIGRSNSSHHDDDDDDFDYNDTKPIVDSITNNENNENGDVRTTENELMINAHIVNDEQLEAQIVARHTQEIRNQVMREAVEATAVAEDQIQNPKTSSSSSFLQRYGVLLACFIVAIVGIIIIIVVVVAVKSKSEKSDDDSELLTYQDLVDMLSPLSGGDVLLNETTPQFAALKWLTKDIESNTTTSSISASSRMDVSTMLLERYSVVLLYFATDGATWLNSLDFLSHKTSVCQWRSLQSSGEDALGIHCGSDGSVIKVKLGTYRCP